MSVEYFSFLTVKQKRMSRQVRLCELKRFKKSSLSFIKRIEIIKEISLKLTKKLKYLNPDR